MYTTFIVRILQSEAGNIESFGLILHRVHDTCYGVTALTPTILEKRATHRTSSAIPVLNVHASALHNLLTLVQYEEISLYCAHIGTESTQIDGTSATTGQV